MFKKTEFFQNLRILLKDKGIPIGVFERAVAKVQIGQISRWERTEGDINPGIELFLAAKETTGVSIDTMLGADFSDSNPDELYLVRVLDSIREDTINRRVRWEEIDANALDGNPLYRNTYAEKPEPYQMRVGDIDAFDYIAAFDAGAFPDGKSFRTILPGDSGMMYLMSCQGEIEVYSAYNTEVSPVCATSQKSEVVEQSLRGLYKTITEMKDRFHLSNNVKSRLDGYLKTKEPKNSFVGVVQPKPYKSESKGVSSQLMLDYMLRDKEEELERGSFITAPREKKPESENKSKGAVSESFGWPFGEDDDENFGFLEGPTKQLVGRKKTPAPQNNRRNGLLKGQYTIDDLIADIEREKKKEDDNDEGN